EVENWAITAPKEGDAQDESPDDDTADGADCIAAGRYAIMSQWRGARFPDTTEDEVVESDRVRQFDAKRREFVEPPHMVDVFEETRRTAPGRPSISTHRPRFKPF
ncbi:MAG TPA: hypothetical protein VNN79_15400, partial [Actinomycetota bacterium]|nr:hypothetical protein [Actinomycetota bacterium]